MMLGTYGVEANPKNRERAAQTRNDRIANKREDLARRLEALKGGTE